MTEPNIEEAPAAIQSWIRMGQLRWESVAPRKEKTEQPVIIEADGIKKSDPTVYEVEKTRVYVDDPSDAPDDVNVQQGDEGGYYYETSGGQEDGEAESGLSDETRSRIEEDVPVASEMDQYWNWDQDAVPVIEDAIRSGTDGGELFSMLDEKAGEFASTRGAMGKAAGNITVAESDVGELTIGINEDTTEAINDQFSEEVSRSQMETVSEAIDGWTGAVHEDETAAMWVAAAEQTGNDNFHRKLTDVVVDNVDSEEVEAIQQYQEHLTEYHREVYGDEVTVYRGVGGDTGQELAEEAEGGTVESTHRAIESWSTNPMVAMSYGSDGAVLQQEIPVEQIIASHLAGAGTSSESEVIVQMEENVEFDDGQVVSGEEASMADAADQLIDIIEQLQEANQ